MNMSAPNTAYISFSAEISPQTSEALIAVCADMSQKGIQTIHLLLSTPGGTVMNGLNIYNMLRAMPFELITHNVGNVDSIGNVVFLAGKKRYACPHATFMFHGVGFDLNGQFRLEEKLLRERLQSLCADQDRIGRIITECTKINAQEVESLFLEAKTCDPDYALTNGIIHEIRDVSIPSGAPVVQLVFKR